MKKELVKTFEKLLKGNSEGFQSSLRTRTLRESIIHGGKERTRKSKDSLSNRPGRGQDLAQLCEKKHVLLEIVKLGATVAGTDPRSTGGHPQL